MVSEDEYGRLEAFRSDLDAYLRFVGGEHEPDVSHPEAMARIRELQPALNRTYGALRPLIHRYSGTMQMGSRLHGVTSHDVVFDAINTLDHPDYPTIAESALQHLDITLGRVQGDVGTINLPDEPPQPFVEVASTSPERYRRTSFLYWAERGWSALIWLFRKPSRAAITGVAVIAAGAVTLFFTVFGADWEQVRRNVDSILRFFGA